MTNARGVMMVEKLAEAIDGKSAVRLWRTVMMMAVASAIGLIWDVRDKVTEIDVLSQRQDALEQRQDRQGYRVDRLEDRVYEWDRSGFRWHAWPDEVPS